MSIAQHQHFAPAAVLCGRADDAFLFHLIDQARGARVADAQLPLQQRDAGLLLQPHHVDGALQQIIFAIGVRLFDLGLNTIEERGLRRRLARLDRRFCDARRRLLCRACLFQ